jgi:hypothetical protein
MHSLLLLIVAYVASFSTAQTDPGCGPMSPPTPTTRKPTTGSPCVLWFTPTMPAQEAPVSTVWATVMTTRLNAVNCGLCEITNVPENPTPEVSTKWLFRHKPLSLTIVKGAFNTKVTSDYLLMTEVACIPTITSITRRHALPEATPEPPTLFVRGDKQQAVKPLVKRKAISLPLLEKHMRRQAPSNDTAPSNTTALFNSTGNPLILAGEAFRLIEQLFTVIYSIGVINSGLDLGGACLSLRSANAVFDLAEVGINATQAALIVCEASLPTSDISMYNETLIASAAAGLFAVQLAANFTGTANTNVLCNGLNLSSLPPVGVDTVAIRNFVCSANNATMNASSTVTATVTVASAGTSIPFPYTNSSGGSFTWLGSITAPGASGTAGTAPWGTGHPPSGTGFYPNGNMTAGPGFTGSGTGVPATGNLPTGTELPASGTIVEATVNAPLGTGISASASFANATGSLSVGTSISAFESGMSGTGALSAGTSVPASAPFANATGSLPVGTGVPASEGEVNETGALPAGTGGPASAPVVNATVTLSVGTGVPASETAVSATGSLPGDTSVVASGTLVNATSNLPAATGLSSSGSGVFHTGNLTAGVSASGTGVFATGATGNIPTGTGYGASGTGIISSNAGSEASGYAPPSGSSEHMPSLNGYGHVPRGPTSTPRYYPKGF